MLYSQDHDSQLKELIKGKNKIQYETMCHQGLKLPRYSSSISKVQAKANLNDKLPTTSKPQASIYTIINFFNYLKSSAISSQNPPSYFTTGNTKVGNSNLL